MLKEPSDALAVAFVTLGCAKNEVDSRTMCASLDEQGFVVVESLEKADFIILNTCAFIEAAVEESLDTLFELVSLDRIKRGEAKLLVAGCLPSRFGDELSSELPEVAAFVPVDQEAELVKTLVRLAEQEGRTLEGLSPVLSQESSAGKEPWAYVKISDGCSRHCSYCTIPAIRGPYQSYPFRQIVSEVKKLTAAGAKEIILIGQDTGIWSEPSPAGRAGSQSDAEGTPHNLAQLLDVLARQYPHTWFRTLYMQPEGINNELLDVMASHKNIARYLDIPLQHASASLLKAMNRKGSRAEYMDLLARTKKALPGVVLRTTVMVGFPGETQEDFEELYGFLEDACFDYVGIFAYSREDGTAAAELCEQVESETAFERVQILRDLADRIGFERAQDQVGKDVEVLICGRDEEGLFGRTQGQAPEVDGVTYLVTSERCCDELTDKKELQPGSIVPARIRETVLYDLFAEVD